MIFHRSSSTDLGWGTANYIATLLLILSPLWLLAGFATSVWQTWPSPLDKLVYGLSFGALVVLAARVEVPAGRLGRLLLVPGTASYSLYLLHQPVLLVLAPYVWRLGLSAPRLWLASIFVGLPALVLLGHLGHFVLERPFLRGGVLRRALLPEPLASSRDTNGATEGSSL